MNNQIQTGLKTQTPVNKLLPVDHLSYSSLIQLLRNPLIFKLKEVLKVYNGKMGVSAVIGKACHRALDFYYNSQFETDRLEIAEDPALNRQLAREAGLDFIKTYDDAWINYGKTGTREQILKSYTQAMDFYFAEEPEYYEILSCEKKLSSEMTTMDGDILPLPGSGIPDLVVKNDKGELEIIDHKFTTSFTNHDEEDFIKIIQSMFMYHLVKGATGITPTRMIFRETKISKNNDGRPQMEDYIIPFDHRPYFVFFYNLYRDAVKYLANDPVFLPNLSDMFDGEHAGLMYSQGLINADMSDVEVMHKVKDVALKSKKFVSSSLDRAENQNLPPAEKVAMRLAEFGLPIEPVDIIAGAQVTQYRFKVSAGVRMASIQKHKADIERTLAVKGSVRILTPIPGTEYIGIEVENETRKLERLTKGHLTDNTLLLPLGADVNGEVTKIDLREMPHLLLAGATGSGKSVTLSTIIQALTSQMTPEDMHLTLIDPKRVELSIYSKKPHLQGRKVIFEPQEAILELTALKDEMDKRYKLLERSGKRDLSEYNDSRKSSKTKLPYRVCIVDEFADLILQSRAPKKKKDDTSSGSDVEYLVTRIAQLGRAAGIHMILATQRPSVDVITGLIKANFPTRIAFRTSSPTDSSVILGETGAEKLVGKGDMILIGPMIRGGKIRLQGLISS
jgi:RecB family exonuclease